MHLIAASVCFQLLRVLVTFSYLLRFCTVSLHIVCINWIIFPSSCLILLLGPHQTPPQPFEHCITVDWQLMLTFSRWLLHCVYSLELASLTAKWIIIQVFVVTIFYFECLNSSAANVFLVTKSWIMQTMLTDLAHRHLLSRAILWWQPTAEAAYLLPQESWYA